MKSIISYAVISFVRRYPFAMLLAVQLISVLIYGFLSNSEASHIVFSSIGLIVPILAVWVVHRSPAASWLGLVLVVLAIGLSLTATFTQQNSLLIWAHTFESLLYFYAATGLTMYMFADDVVTRDELYAAGATFTLLVWGFAFAYSVCQQIVPGSITAAMNPDMARTWVELLFMSFSIQSGTGIGDIVPVSNAARAISSIQMFTGLMYIAVVISHLVGLAASTKANNNSD
ncbi:ion channel [Methylotenera versatilis]|uniref:ion channel n=1 Tax=Methylotenera versatilis TaxID=1055487 RepID=UPI00064636B0|nr:ion channel [Methylotenera versatilis]